MSSLLVTMLTGIGATAVLDCWSMLRRRLLGLAPPNYAMVGRWMAGWPSGRFRLGPIGSAKPVRGERAIGWIAHYLIGIAYAALLVALWGPGWLRQPSLGPALLVGVVTVAAPFLLMQPAMGLGVAAARTPDPAAVRLQSLLSHVIFGCGLYASARLAQLVLAA